MLATLTCIYNMSARKNITRVHGQMDHNIERYNNIRESVAYPVESC